MINNAIRWHILDRDALAEVLLEGLSGQKTGRLDINTTDLHGDRVAVGAHESHGGQYNPACLILLREETAVETFSWLRAYAPETSPLSQFGRVVSANDWRAFRPGDLFRNSFTPREDTWACIVLGEAVAQGDTDAELAQLPLSRAAACFSFAMARAACVHGSDEATRTCAERLRFIEADRRVARRHVSVSDLLPIWSITGAKRDEKLSVEDAVGTVLDAAYKYMPELSTQGMRIAGTHLRGYPGLTSDSIEQRVLAFQQLSNELVRNTETSTRDPVGAVSLAAAAFLVGRSTSHEFLLRRVSQAFPTSPIWFGLLAALCGPASWEPTWVLAMKGVERQIRATFDWADSSGWDLCWPEFMWFADTFDGDVFSKLPKLTSRALAIEILPGAVCQFRLAAAGPGDMEPRTAAEPASQQRDLQAALAQFVNLAARTKQLLESQPSPPVQQSLVDSRSPLKTYGPKKKRSGEDR
jgi:hypothetical protein